MGISKDDFKHLQEVEEGPYYKEESPARNSIAEDGTIGNKLVFEGRVLDKDGIPLPGALLDFWHADGHGIYDNTGFNLRGHQHTDKNGCFRLETVEPALYGSRTPHIHLKVQATAKSRIYTTQLYFPDKPSNEKDPLFVPSNTVSVTESPDGKKAYFDIVIST